MDKINFSFHTMELKLKLTPERYQELIDIYNDESKLLKYAFYKKDINRNSWEMHRFKKMGIILKLNRSEKGCSLELQTNPRRLKGDQEYIGIFEPGQENVDELLYELKNKAQELHLPEFENFILKRLDLCVNIEFDTPEIAEDYLNLLIKSRVPKPFTVSFYDENGKKDKNGIYFKAAEFTIYIYNKNYQVKKEIGEKFCSDKGLIRFEIRIRRSQLRRMMRERGKESLRDILLEVEAFSRDQFSYYIPRIFLSGDYLNYAETKLRIEKSNYYDSTKYNMLYLIEKCTVGYELGTATFQLIKDFNLNQRQVDSLFQHFDELGINPLCIPQRAKSKSKKLESIPHLLDLI